MPGKSVSKPKPTAKRRRGKRSPSARARPEPRRALFTALEEDAMYQRAGVTSARSRWMTNTNSVYRSVQWSLQTVRESHTHARALSAADLDIRTAELTLHAVVLPSPRRGPCVLHALPDEVIVVILCYLPVGDLVQCDAVCHHWMDLGERAWTVLYDSYFAPALPDVTDHPDPPARVRFRKATQQQVAATEYRTAAIRAVEQINKVDVEETRCYYKPPEGAVVAICLLANVLGINPHDEWRDARAVLDNKGSFIRSMLHFDPLDLTARQVAAIQKGQQSEAWPRHPAKLGRLPLIVGQWLSSLVTSREARNKLLRDVCTQRTQTAYSTASAALKKAVDRRTNLMQRSAIMDQRMTSATTAMQSAVASMVEPDFSIQPDGPAYD